MAKFTITLDVSDGTELANTIALLDRFRQAQRVAPATTQSNHPASNPQTAWSADTSPEQAVSPADPWGAQEPAPSQASAPAQAAASAPTASQPASPPMCKHGQMRLVPGGIAKTGPRTGQPYAPFYACTADRNDPTKCKSVKIP